MAAGSIGLLLVCSYLCVCGREEPLDVGDDGSDTQPTPTQQTNVKETGDLLDNSTLSLRCICFVNHFLILTTILVPEKTR